MLLDSLLRWVWLSVEDFVLCCDEDFSSVEGCSVDVCSEDGLSSVLWDVGCFDVLLSERCCDCDVVDDSLVFGCVVWTVEGRCVVCCCSCIDWLVDSDCAVVPLSDWLVSLDWTVWLSVVVSFLSFFLVDCVWFGSDWLEWVAAKKT